MTRAEVHRSYVVRDGEIVTPGRWEGAPVFAPYFYEAYRAGRPVSRSVKRGEGEVLAVYYVVEQRDRLAFRELLDVDEVVLYVDVEAKLDFIACDVECRRLGGRPPNVGDEETD